MSFLTNFFKAGGDSAMESVITAVATRAPDTAGKAQLKTLDDDLTDTGNAISELKQALREATTENETIHQQYSELLGAAEVLQKEIDDPNTPDAVKASKTTSLNNLLGQIEHMVPQVDKDQQRVERLTGQLHDAEELYRQKASDMVHSGADLEEAKHDLKSAELDEQRAKRDAAMASKLAGITTGPATGLTAATDALRNATKAAQQRTDGLDLKSQTLRTVNEGAKGDPNIAAAIAAAKGTTSPSSLSDRLKALQR